MMVALALDLPQKYLQQVQALLHEHVPDAEVWAYGSRVSGGGHEASDLDLVLRNPADLRAESRALFDLKEAFVESNLPIRVDVMDWARIPESFHREIASATRKSLRFPTAAILRVIVHHPHRLHESIGGGGAHEVKSCSLQRPRKRIRFWRVRNKVSH